MSKKVIDQTSCGCFLVENLVENSQQTGWDTCCSFIFHHFPMFFGVNSMVIEHQRRPHFPKMAKDDDLLKNQGKE